jgi:hypothetical protein
MPSPEAIDAMMKYNEELKKAGALLALEGLHPPASGARHLQGRKGHDHRWPVS